MGKKIGLIERIIYKIIFKRLTKYLGKMKGSFKTKLAAILAGLAILFSQIGYLFDTDPSTMPDFATVIEAFAVMGIGWFARDNDKSSEDVGAKPGN